MTAQINDQVVYIANYASDTSRKAAEKVLPKTGTMRKTIYDIIAGSANGATDWEIEKVTGIKHQTASATRRSLVIDGFIVDSGKTRKNNEGNECIVWITPMIEMRLF